MLRLFLGLAPPAPVRARLATLQNGVPGARWVDPADLHITLRFIGEIDEDVAEDLDLHLRQGRLPGGTVSLYGVGRFGDSRGARSLHVDVVPDPWLLHLHERCETLCQHSGLPAESRRFHPHVTLARFSGRGSLRVDEMVAVHSTWNGGTFSPSHLHLFRSHLGRDGARYEEMAAYPLTPVPTPETG